MATYARRRLIRDFKKISNDPPHGVSGAPLDGDIMHWHAVIFGPEDTPWEGGTFQLDFKFTEDYPNKPPTVMFSTKMFHPNVYADGQICLDILQNQWSPIYDVSAILTSIQSLLSDPNPNSPANVEAAQLFSENRREYNRRVAKCVEGSWENLEDGDNNNNNNQASSASAAAAAAAAAAGPSDSDSSMREPGVLGGGGSGGSAVAMGASAGGGPPALDASAAAMEEGLMNGPT
ncbi:unnamed protein product [Vitrella brassicaformis CCMP3155]|uniref:UBC core domain-containing protein n=2 Tax=Vitrella brassicaformis TaxID=1169539 RepID=A0A0G4FEK0_VITBC|nr:unnamed protein product [Vitrella brassicaformis CCMP3155]|mmetsp:Transcript_3303/g.7491  ORF Transcript_3303/g.7491 Transcript_3303/m.7491 type:complete len:233 (+) Transcript_3303:197-895(+)|eukprot:CEM11636.1 unnamed protein product [Vitrella brassicaformis CCMP3155]